MTPLVASPTVGAKCRDGINDISIIDGKDVEQGNDGARAGLGNKHDKHTRCTQVRGPLVEVTPLRLALLFSYCKITKFRTTMMLLELFLVVAGWAL